MRSRASRILVMSLRSRSRILRVKLRSVSREARSVGSGKGATVLVMSVLVLSASPRISSSRSFKRLRKNSKRSVSIIDSALTELTHIFRGSLRPAIFAAGSTAFFQQKQILDYQAAIHRLTHVINGE